jgi:serine/threonine protein kinase/tetratricopeptide (TPR) repeat protein
MPDAKPSLITILAGALARTDPAEQNAYLDRTCGVGTALRRRVESLLAEDATADLTLGSGRKTGSATPTSDSSEATRASVPDTSTSPEVTGEYQPDASVTEGTNVSRAGPPGEFVGGQVIAGRYTLLEVMGEGGMGTVYRAAQTEPVRRQVALKLIKIGMDSRAVLARFDAERQALAMMEHPNIARVFDGGTTATGQPFFVMELVEGDPITRYCDRSRLSLRGRLELFVAVCKAVQHAHQKGIIHRDLKPGNVLVTEVDGRPTPKVIDFGVAKATEFDLTDRSLNDTGAIVGTPTYMSPEQADPSSMDIDTRTDVYALGVILYELLVGSTPIDAKQFKRGAILEMLRMVREVEPPRPSTRLSTAENLANIASNRSVEPARLAKSLRGELDWVVMKALEKDRTRRYETASGFARDLERYLADEVVEARPPSRGYRFRKFIRRYKGQVIAASLVTLALVAGVIGTSLGMLEAQHQKHYAETGWGRAENERQRAELNLGTARLLILNMGTQINQIATGQKDPKLADLARKQALDQARRQFDEFRAGSPDDETVQLQAAALHRYAGNVSRSLSDYPSALSAYGSAIQILEHLTATFPENAHYQDTLALTLVDRALLEKNLGKLIASAATLDRAYAVAEKSQGKILESSYMRTLGVIEIERSYVAFTRGLFEDSLRSARRANELYDGLLEYTKDRPPVESNVADPLYAVFAVDRLAIARRELGQTTQALAAHADAIARMKALTKPDSNQDVRFFGCEVRLERARTGAKVIEQRAALADDLAEVSRICEKLVDEYPYLGFYRERLATSYMLRGELLTLLDQPETATAELTKSLKVSRDQLDRFGGFSAPMLVRAQTFLALGRARAAAGKNNEAIAHWKNAATVFGLGLKVDPDNFHHRRGLAEAEQALKQVGN